MCGPFSSSFFSKPSHHPTFRVSISHTLLAHDVACLDLVAPQDGSPASHLLVGLWEALTVSILRLPDFAAVTTERLGGDILPRSILATEIAESMHVFVGLGDGSLVIFQWDTAASRLTLWKKINLGSQPVALNTILIEGRKYVFASSDQPTVIYSSGRKLAFAMLNNPAVRVFFTAGLCVRVIHEPIAP